MSAYPDSALTPPDITTSSLMEAIHRRDAERVRLLVEAGARLETGTGRPLLHEAAEAGMLWLVERILATGVGVDLRDEDGNTPLGAAAWGGRLAVVRRLLAKGADVAARISRGSLVRFGPLELSAQRGAPGCVEALLAAGARLDPSANVFREMLGEWSAEDDHRGHSPSYESLEAVAAVLARGSVEPSLERDPHVRIARLLGPSASAADVAAARDLLDRRRTKSPPPPPDARAAALRGRELSAADKRALLLSLATTGDVKALQAVGLEGAPRLFGKESSDTPLHCAARAGSMEAVELLLAAGFDPNFFTAVEGQETTRSPLTDAFATGHVDVARRLAEAGAVAAMPKNIRPYFQAAVVAAEIGICIAECAHPLVECDDLETLTWFLARPETQRHVLLLADAIDRDDLDRVRALLDAGVPVNDKLGKFVPLDVARALEHAAIVELLVARGATSKRKPPKPSRPAAPTPEKRIRDLRAGKIAPDLSLMDEARHPLSEALFEALLERADAGLLVQMLCSASHGDPDKRAPFAWIERLLAKGADVDGVFSGARSETPLGWACAPPYPEAVKLLLAHGADARWKNQHGWAAVHALVTNRPPEPVRGKPALLQAYSRDAEEVIHRMLDAGMDPITELDLALRSSADVAAWFVSHPSVKPDLVLPQMGSPMHGAATRGDAAMLRQLLARGGDPSARAANRGESPKVKLGQTPLHVLSSLTWDQPPLEALEVLLEAGAAVNALDADGQTPLDVVGFRAVRARLRAAGGLGGREIAEAEV